MARHGQPRVRVRVPARRRHRARADVDGTPVAARRPLGVVPSLCSATPSPRRSQTTDLRTAVPYPASEESVLLRLRTTSFMARGADISFISAFAAESEVLFPPLTYLKVEEQHQVQVPGTDVSFTVIDITPLIS